MDHDQRFKILIREFFPQFLQLFFPQFSERFDFTQISWLDKEVFADPPQGERGSLDLVAQLSLQQPIRAQRPTETDSPLALVHVEVEHADSVEPLRARMYEYYEQLRRRHRKPVLPIALYLQVGLNGIGVDVYEEHIWEHRTVRFEYLYVGLPALDAETYLRGDSWLGLSLSSLMRAPSGRKRELAVQGLRRLVKCSENEWRRFLLGDCLAAYAAENSEERRELEQLIDAEANREIKIMTQTWYDQGLQQGVQQGIQQGVQQGVQQGAQQGQRKLLRLQLEERFGPLSARVLQRLDDMPADRLPDLGRALLKAQSLRQLGLED